MGLGSRRTTALVTGAAGFLGSHLVDRLLGEGFEVIGLDNLMTGDLGNLESASGSPRFHLEIGDVRETLGAYAPLIFNLACPASPLHYRSDPYATFTTSVLGAMRLVDEARRRTCRIVHASTSEVYGDPEVHPQREDYWGHVNPIGERACYDEGKRGAETLFTDARRAFGADVRVVRIFNTYGPRMAEGDGRVVSNFIVQALEDAPLTLHGDGEQARSFCYVSDMIDGLVAAARVPSFDSPINLGNPETLTIRQLADVVMNVSGKTLTIENRPKAADDPRRRCPDITKAQAELGFAPKVSLEEGIRATYADFAARRGR